MLKRFYMALIILWCALSLVACTTSYPVKVGDNTVIIKRYQHGAGKNFIHVHQSETTALIAAKTVVSQQGGSVLTLVHGGGRNIIFHIHKRRYEFDPNRIFTDTGIKKTLSNFGRYDLQAHREVSKLAIKIIKLLPRGTIIAVHNNKSYSFKDYYPGHSLAIDAQKLHIFDKGRYRNFYLATSLQDFVRLKKLAFNSVLQNHNVRDDGSLSVFLRSRKYINIEAAYDQLGAQISMLKHV